MIYAGTGHRPPRLGLAYGPSDRQKLMEFARERLRALPDVSKVISGGAQGWDQALAHAAHWLRLPYIVAVPFEGQDARWPEDARVYYQHILKHADEVVVVSPGGYANWKYEARDRWMVDNTNRVLALLDDKPEKSGTRITVEYAQKRRVEVLNIWSHWTVFRGS